MATYNRAHLIQETLHSIQQQTFFDWECLIIDDGGTDTTQEVITPILEKDNRMQFLKRPDSYQKGLPGSRNYGLDVAQGEYIIFFDDDDIVHPDNLQISLAILKTNNVDFCHYQKQSFGNKVPDYEFCEPKLKQFLNISHLYEIVTHKIGLASCTILWNKKCFETIRFKEELLYAEEWECYSRIIAEGFEGLSIQNVLYYNRKHPNSNTGEFYSNNPIRKKSKSEATVYIVSNLIEKNLLTDNLMRFFVQFSLNYKDYFLFEHILGLTKFQRLKKIRWIVFFTLLPVKLYVHRFVKQLKKNMLIDIIAGA